MNATASAELSKQKYDMKRVAAIGDIHGRLDLLESLYKKLEWESLDEIRHSGDLIHRGPDSGGVVSFCREKGLSGVKGNHESASLEREFGPKRPPKNKLKLEAYHALINHPENLKYLQDLPYLHIDDELRTVFVHAGVLPKIPFYAQPVPNVAFLAMIHPRYPGQTRWLTMDRHGRSEAENRANGWKPWWEVYDHEYRVVFGHTVFRHNPLLYKPGPDIGECISIDTGAVWCGQLTAVILPDLRFISTPLTRAFTGPEGMKYDDYGF